MVIEAPLRELTQEQQDLLHAEAYMREHGWCKERAQDDEGRVCVAAAVGLAIGMVEGRSRRQKQALDRLARSLGAPIVTWNDFLCGSEQEALAALRKAAE